MNINEAELEAIAREVRRLTLSYAALHFDGIGATSGAYASDYLSGLVDAPIDVSGLAAKFATHPAEQASAGSIGSLPTNDEVYAEVCRDRGKSNFYVSTNAVNDVMQAVRKLAAPLAPSDTQGAEGLTVPTWQDRITAALDANPSCNFDAVKAESIWAEIKELRAALAQQATNVARGAKLAEVHAFLCGSAPLDGIWFGERHPTERGAFWWRKYLWEIQSAAPKLAEAGKGE